jgi:hypothetical protein
MLRRLIERVIIRQAEGGLYIELVGEIVRLIELGLEGKRAALSAEEACSVKVVARAATTIPNIHGVVSPVTTNIASIMGHSLRC